nr:GHKL domain-containing protein [uncultured Sphaerochaeta sp.]
MQDLISNSLRGSVTSIMNVLLLFTLTKSKYGRRSNFLIVTLVFIIGIASNSWFYMYGNLTGLSRFNIVMFIVLGICLKPLAKTGVMQWSFNFLTTVNIMMMIIILSFHLGKLFPYPQYAHTLIRLFLYLLIIFSFQRYLLPFYNSVTNNWRIFSLLVICIFLNLGYYFYVTADIENTLLSAKWPLLLLVMLSLAAYGTVFYSLRRLTAMHALETEHLKDQHERTLLSQAASTMTERLQLMDKLAHEHSLVSHDRRHFNNMLLELLQQGEIEEAITCLRKQNEIKMHPARVYCENKAVNAVVCHYLDLAEQKGLLTNVRLAIPAQLPFDSLELALVVANLLENAIQGVSLLPEERRGIIQLSCQQFGRLLLEISNPCMETVTLGPDGFPYSVREGHGVGTKSIAAFAAKHDAELLYRIQDGQFRVRLLI